jgi:predicted permease
MPVSIGLCVFNMIELLQIFVDNIAPILLIAGLGYIIGKRLNLETDAVSALNFNILSPALVFHSVYNSNIGGDELASIALSFIVFQAVMLSLAWFVLRVQAVSAEQRSNVFLAVISMNVGNYGLSLVAFAFGEAVLSRAVIIFIVNATMNYTIGVYIASNGNVGAKDALIAVLRNPPLYAVFVAFGLRALNIEMPVVASRSIQTLAEAAIPMMLIMLGLQLARFQPVPRIWNLLATGISLRMLLAPIVAMLISSVFALTGDAHIAFVLQASMPTSVVSLVLATEYRLDRNLALTFVFITTLISPITLSILIALLQRGT